MGDPETVPAGQYAREALENYGLWASLLPRLVPAANVRAALAYVEDGVVDAGIVYSTDARTAEVRVEFVFPEDAHSSIVYPVVVLRDAPRREEAMAFLRYLSSSRGTSRFERAGFQRHALNP